MLPEAVKNDRIFAVAWRGRGRGVQLAGKFILVTAASAAAFVLLVVIFAKDPPPCGTTGDAYHMAKKFVSGRLRAPRTAEFPRLGATGVFVREENECLYTVTGYVDAQNGFGAMIRTRYTMVVRKARGQDSWWMVSSQFD